MQTIRHKKFFLYSLIAGIAIFALGLLLGKLWPLYDLYILIAVSFGFVTFLMLFFFRRVHDDAQQIASNTIAITDGWNQFYLTSGLQMNMPLLTSFTITPDFAFLLTKTIQDKKPATIIELGGGRSTLIAAAVLKKENINGKIISIDADAKYQEQCMQFARNNKLDAYITFVYTTLTDIILDSEKFYWYDLKNFEKVNFDLLIIDGPPEVPGTLSRYPALPQFIASANRNAIILADDANRSEMKKTEIAWKNKYPAIRIAHIPLMRGVLYIECNPV